MASCSPCANARGVYFLFGEGTLVKLTPDGTILWQRNLVAEYGPLVINFGYSASGLLHDERLYITVLRHREDKDIDGLDSYLLCVDTDDGKTVFKHSRDTDADKESTNAYVTPVLIMADSGPQIVVYGADYLTGHDPHDGHQVWRYLYAKPQTTPMRRQISTPVTNGKRLFCSYPRGTRLFALDLAKAARNEPPEVWTYAQPGPDVSCPLLYRQWLYTIDESKKTLICLDPKTGQLRWTGQLDKSDMYYASPTAADGKLYIVNRKGVVTVVAADPDTFTILSTHSFGEKPVDSSIAIAGGKLYLRTAENLYCFGRP